MDANAYKKRRLMIIILATVILVIAVGIFGVKNYLQDKACDVAYNEIRETLIESAIIVPGENNYFNHLSIKNITNISGNVLDEFNATIKNNSNVKLCGSIVVVVFFKGEIIGFGKLLLPVSGLNVNESATIDGYLVFGFDGKYDRIKFYDGGIRKYD